MVVIHKFFLLYLFLNDKNPQFILFKPIFYLSESDPYTQVLLYLFLNDKNPQSILHCCLLFAKFVHLV